MAIYKLINEIFYLGKKRYWLTVFDTDVAYAGTVSAITTAPFSDDAGSWSDITNAQDDTTSTSSQFSISGPGTKQTDGMKAVNFGHTISGTIDDCQLEVECSLSTTGTFEFARLVLDDAVTSNTDNDGGTWPATKAYSTAKTGLWGETPTDTQVNAADFGYAFNGSASTGMFDNFDVYRIKSTITFSVSGDQEIVVTIDSSDITSGNTITVGRLETEDGTTDVTINVANSGSADDLTHSSTVISGTHSSLAAIETALPGAIEPGTNDDLVIRIDVSGQSSEIADLDIIVTINTDDADEAAFVVNIDGSVLFPRHEINTAGEGSEAADAGVWDQSSPPSSTNRLRLWSHRTKYFHGGDKVLYGYARSWDFDSAGNLEAVSAETRYVIDTPE